MIHSANDRNKGLVGVQVRVVLYKTISIQTTMTVLSVRSLLGRDPTLVLARSRDEAQMIILIKYMMFTMFMLFPAFTTCVEIPLLVVHYVRDK